MPTTIGKERAYSIDGIATSADHSCIAAAGGFGGAGVFVWSLDAKHTLLFRNKVANDSVWAVALSPNADVLYGKGRFSVLRWHLDSKKELPPFEVSGNNLSVMTLSPDGAQLACASYQSLRQAPWTEADRVAVLDAETGEERAGVETEAWALAYSPDGKLLAYSSRTAMTKDAEMVIMLRDAQQPTLPLVRRISAGRMITQLTFSPDGRGMAAADGEKAGLIAVYSVADGQAIATFSGHEGRTTCLAFSPDDATLAATDDNGTLKCWAIASGKLTLDVHGKHESLSAVTFLDADHVAAGGRDVDEGPPISVWNVAVDRGSP